MPPKQTAITRGNESSGVCLQDEQYIDRTWCFFGCIRFAGEQPANVNVGPESQLG